MQIAGIGLLTAGIGGLIAAATDAADTMAGLEARMLNATGSQAGLAAGMSDVVSIANQTRNGISEVGTLYTKMVANSRNLGISQAEASTATRSFAMALKVGGASAGEASASILQLSQAMSSGVLAGDEFKSLAENSPVFMDILAESMGVGRGALKALGAEGKITGKQITEALTDPAIIAKIEEQFGRIPVSFADIRTSIGNTAMQIASSLAKGLNFTDSLAVGLAKFNEWTASILPSIQAFGAQLRDSFGVIAPVIKGVFAVVGPLLGLIVNNLGNITRAALAVGAAFATWKVGGMIAGVVQQVTALGVSMGATGGIGAFFTGVMQTATGAVMRLTAAMMANPFLAIAAAVVAVVGLLYQFSDQIQIGTDGMGTLADICAVVWSDISAGLSALGALFASVWNGVVSGATSVWNAIESAFSPITSFFESILGPVVIVWQSMFGGIELSFMGVVRFIARGIDVIINGFVNGATLIGNVWKLLPQMLGAAITGAVNFVVSGVEKMINFAISGINRLIAGINKIPGIDIGEIGNVSLGRMSGPAMPSMGAVTAGMSYQSYAEDYVNGLGDRADARAAGRNRGANDAKPQGAQGTANDIAADSGAGKGKTDGERRTKDVENATAKYAEFLAKMREENDLALMLKHEAELHNKLLEARKILGKDLSDAQRDEITGLVNQKRLNDAIGAMKQQTFELGNKSRIEAMRVLGLNEKDAKVQDDILAIRLKHLDAGGKLEDFATALWQTAERELATQAGITAEREKQAAVAAQLVKGGNALAERYDNILNPKARAKKDRSDRDKLIANVSRREGETDEAFKARVLGYHEESLKEYNDAMSEIANKFRSEMVGAINQIGDAIGGKFGELLNGIANAIDQLGRMQQGDYSGGGLLGGIARLGSMFSKDFGDSVKSGLSGFSPENIHKAFSNPMESMGSSFKSFTSAFSGPNGFIKGIGSAIGGAMAGAQMGGAIAGVGKMVWSKFSTTGAQVGGALGSFLGPIGSAVGSVLGGIVGGLFKKTKKASQGFQFNADGKLVAGSANGNSTRMQAEVAGMGNQVVAGIYAIAQQLGADLRPVHMATLALRENSDGTDHVKVDPTGRGKTKNKEGTIDFGTNGHAAAIAWVIADALRKGVLTGISSFSNKIMRRATEGTLEAMVALASQYEAVLRDLDLLKDPIGGGARTIVKSLDELSKAMVKQGATTAELAKVEEYRSIKLNEYIEDQLSGLKSFKEDLMGSSGGFTALSILNRDMDEFAQMRADILAGRSVDQEDFTNLGQNILGNASEVYGSGTQAFVDIRNMLLDATNGLITNTQSSIEDATTVAIREQTAQVGVTNDLLREINESLRGINGGSGGGLRSVNGVQPNLS